jgi:glycosyltransferase involved in cell wall biosynthesis
MTSGVSGDSTRLLYLGFAFPPGVAALHPGLNPAGHALETQMVRELRALFDVRSVGTLPFAPPWHEAADPDSGVAHELLLVEKAPELFHRYRSLHRLKAQYTRWCAEGWLPDAILVYNLSPIYNQFLLWLQRRPRCPRLVLLLLDSSSLGQTIPRTKRFRHRFKPMQVADTDMLDYFDACIGLSRTVEKYFVPRGIPFLWMPGGCTPGRALSVNEHPEPMEADGPTRFAYFGALGPHSGVKALAEIFAAAPLSATLDICGYGKQAVELAALVQGSPRLRFHGLLSPAECLRFGRLSDVLVNPRPATHGNENNFPSKLFEYAMCGRAILTASLSGVNTVLGTQAGYFDPYDFEPSLKGKLSELAALPRAELNRRGLAIQQRVVTEYTWAKQAERMAVFLERVCHGRLSPEPVREALAA